MTVQAILGIDTSNYTTSLAALRCEDGELLSEVRQPLPVKPGERGLRQSEALYHHVHRLPRLADTLMGSIGERVTWQGVGVSCKPRPFASSHMPVFSAGQNFAITFARLTGIPLVTTSHQEGHVEAARRSADDSLPNQLLVVHLSGGTSDVFSATQSTYGYNIRMIGEGADLHAGQFVDRIGVLLGLPFPAGPALETLAQQAAETDFRLPSRSLGASLSFSGACSAAERALALGIDHPTLARAVEASIANAVVKALQAASDSSPELSHALVVGGVASNQWIRNRVISKLQHQTPRLTVDFSAARFASDNAFGVASIAWRALNE